MTQPHGTQNIKMRVLIADDVQETRRNTRLMLATIDDVEVVAIASNGLEALKLAQEHTPDIAFLDINMPEMDGLTAYKEISKVSPSTGCVVISAEKDTTTLRTAMSIGVPEYLIKPFTVEELEIAVANVKEKVMQLREKVAQDTQVRKQREAYLAQLAAEFAKSRRTDDKAIEVFEQLAENPKCDIRWIKNLAMIYIVRQKWGKLKTLAEKVEKRSK